MTVSKPLPIVILTSFLALFLMTPAALAEDAANAACAQEFDRCLDTCELDFHDDAARRAACVPVCSGKFAACDAGVAYDKAKPWLEDQARKTKDFFDTLIDRYGKKDAPETPDRKTRDNSI